MSLHKLSAGSGYTYLTRQVAAGDVTARGRGSLGAYYEQRGETPGVWLGSGLPSLEGGPRAGDPVSEAQMVALFGRGAHPNADTRPTPARGRSAGRHRHLGAPFVTDGPAGVGGRLRPDLLPGQERLGAVGDRRPGPSPRRSRPRTPPPSRTRSAGWRRTPPTPALGADGVPAGRRHAGCSRRRSPTATPAPATRICTPTSPSRNKVQTLDGRWLALDGRALFKNDGRRLRAVQHPPGGPAGRPARRPLRRPARCGRGKRPVREIVGVDGELPRAWSIAAGRGSTDRRAELTDAVPAPPRPAAHRGGGGVELAQQATLETRQAKHEPRSYAEQRAHLARRGRAACSAASARLDALRGRRAARPAQAAAATSARVPRRRVGGLGAPPTRCSVIVSSGARDLAANHVRAEAERQARAAGIRAGRPRRRRSTPLVTASPSSTQCPSARSAARHARPDVGAVEPGAAAPPGRHQRLHRRRHPALHHPRRPGRRTNASSPRPAGTDGGVPAGLVELALLEAPPRRPAPQRRAAGDGPRAGHLRAAGCSSRSPRPGPARPPPCACWRRAWTDAGGTVLGAGPVRGRRRGAARRRSGSRRSPSPPPLAPTSGTAGTSTVSAIGPRGCWCWSTRPAWPAPRTWPT